MFIKQLELSDIPHLVHAFQQANWQKTTGGSNFIRMTHSTAGVVDNKSFSK